jgi:hypothetical protein
MSLCYLCRSNAGQSRLNCVRTRERLRARDFQWRRLQQHIPYAGLPKRRSLQLLEGSSPSLHCRTIQQLWNGNYAPPHEWTLSTDAVARFARTLICLLMGKVFTILSCPSPTRFGYTVPTMSLPLTGGSNLSMGLRRRRLLLDPS